MSTRRGNLECEPGGKFNHETTMSAQDLSKLGLDTAHSVLAKLPPSVQRALLNSYVQKALGVLVALRLVKGLNSYLSKRAQNNGQSISKWSPQKELVVVTGGCSGIGKQIMEDLSRMNVKTIILDLNEPNFSLRESPMCRDLLWKADSLKSSKCVLLCRRCHIPRSRERCGRANQKRPRPSYHPGQQCRCRISRNHIRRAG